MTGEEAWNRIDAIIEKHEVDDVYVTINNHKDYDALRFARKLLEQEHCEDEYIKVPKKALKYRTAGMVAYNAEWLKNHFDIERSVICGVQQSCGDAVSRQAVFEQINCWIGSGEYRYTNATDYLNKRIKALQAVNPQEKVGYWMPIAYPTGVETFGVKEMSAQELQCSKCGKTVDISDGDFKYCPYCKARMVEPRESEVSDADTN